MSLSLQASTSSAPPTFKVASLKISTTCCLNKLESRSLNKLKPRFCTLLPAFLTTPTVLNSAIPWPLQPRLLMITTSLTSLFMRSRFRKASPLVDSSTWRSCAQHPLFLTVIISNNTKFPTASVKTHVKFFAALRQYHQVTFGPTVKVSKNKHS